MPTKCRRTYASPSSAGAYGIASKALLDAALDVDPGGLLERDDVGGVLHGSLDVLAAGAANDLVDAVEHGKAGDLASAGMRVREPAADHDTSLARGPRHGYGETPRPAVRVTAP